MEQSKFGPQQLKKKTKKGIVDENLNWPVVAATFRIRPIFFLVLGFFFGIKGIAE